MNSKIQALEDKFRFKFVHSIARILGHIYYIFQMAEPAASESTYADLALFAHVLIKRLGAFLSAGSVPKMKLKYLAACRA